jgi:hypothetical protein
LKRDAGRNLRGNDNEDTTMKDHEIVERTPLYDLPPGDPLLPKLKPGTGCELAVVADGEIVGQQKLIGDMLNPRPELEFGTRRNGEHVIIAYGEVVASRGAGCWITQKEGVAVFVADDLGIEIFINVKHDGKLLPIGSVCSNVTGETYFQKTYSKVTLQ